jgi:hypothetical protein
MALDRQKLKDRIHELYRSEHDEMGGGRDARAFGARAGVGSRADASSGGVVVFPHAGVLDCGHQVAAAVHGCLDSGADRVLVIGVLHAFTDEMQEARTRVSAGDDPSQLEVLGNSGAGYRGTRGVARGELHGSILDMTYTDAAPLYEAPAPTWVAAPLVEWRTGVESHHPL